MKKRWRLILPIVGLLVFGAITYHALQRNRSMHSSRYFWWSGTRLKIDPLNRHTRTVGLRPCQDGEGDASCVSWEPEFIWVEPGILTIVLIVSALPSFALGGLAVRAFGHFGVSELTTFMIAMPLLLAGWYFLLGWFFDWLGCRWRQRRQPPVSALPFF